MDFLPRARLELGMTEEPDGERWLQAHMRLLVSDPGLDDTMRLVRTDQLVGKWHVQDTASERANNQTIAEAIRVMGLQVGSLEDPLALYAMTNGMAADTVRHYDITARAAKPDLIYAVRIPGHVATSRRDR